MKKIFKSIWILFLLPVIVTVVGGIITSKLQDINILEGILSFLKWIFNSIVFILNINIPLWVLLIVGIIIFAILLIIVKINDASNIKKWYEDYNDDIYEGIRYAWNYSELYNEITIKNFRPICNKCKGELIKRSSYGNYYYGTAQNYCPNCDKILKTPNSEEIDIANVYVHNKLIKMQEDVKKQINTKNKK